MAGRGGISVDFVESLEKGLVTVMIRCASYLKYIMVFSSGVSWWEKTTFSL